MCREIERCDLPSRLCRLRSCSAAVAALSLVLIVPASRLAAQTPGSIEVGAEGGRYGGGVFARGTNGFFSTKSEADEYSMGGFWLAAQVSPKWKLEVTYRRTTTSVVGYAGGIWTQQPALAGLDVAIAEVVAERAYRLGRFAPYFGGGAGLTNLDINLPDRSRRNPTRGSLAVNGGARFYLTPWLGVRIDMRLRAAYLGQRSAPYDHGWSDLNRWYRTSEGLAGIFVALAGW